MAVRFYFRPSFPDTLENRQFAADAVRSISREIPVVLLNTGLKVDDHDDPNVPGMGIHHVDRLMTAERNLEVQTEIVSNARAFIGTYGGLAYLATFYGVPSFAFYSTQAELLPSHMDVCGVPDAADGRAGLGARYPCGGHPAQRARQCRAYGPGGS